MKFGADGRLLRDQPRVRVLRRRAGHQPARRTRTRSTRSSANTVFTNTALTDDGDVWWEGITDEPPAHLTDWHGKTGRPSRGHPAAHPNARFCVPRRQCPIIAPEWEDPERRADLGVPLRWPPRHDRAAGVRVARLAARRVRRRDDGLGEDGRRGRWTRRAAPRPVRDAALLRLQHGRLLRPLAVAWPNAPTSRSSPRIYGVNWFRKDADGKFLWPGFGENSRVLEWICRRLDGEADGADTPIGAVPRPEDLDLDGLSDDARDRVAAGAAGRRRGVASGAADHSERFRHLRRQAPSRLARRAHRPRPPSRRRLIANLARSLAAGIPGRRTFTRWRSSSASLRCRITPGSERPSRLGTLAAGAAGPTVVPCDGQGDEPVEELGVRQRPTRPRDAGTSRSA